MKFFTKVYGFLSARIEAFKKVFDVRDVLVYGGLFFIGYGLYQLYPWLGFTAFGVLSMLLGLGWLIRVPK
jgi:hypothetical protein